MSMPLAGSSYQDFKVYMNNPMVENASEEQVRKIKFESQYIDDVEKYWLIREYLKPEHLSKAEAIDIIEEFVEGRYDFYTDVLIHKIKEER